ncbi:hypothetical protein BLA24_11735 [Streptomyces cinnamoneus]|uniref:Secreted protein n=1 Tax=Streptomyces cinnamoneus TaxID=53446 RepID=A0A2G1XKP8_STRCJ|nr:hypothetical protein [Streptomyces cinnamoneus]PHQ51751.1 hypothetical protein BLA24_11735 [Streptomyces cinnamoneus]PPT11999.1 hypothetical protein CYQ11_02975 [Streptomyces cinnamoneus]
MRVTKFTTAAAAAVCGSLALGIAGPALADGLASEPAVVESAPGSAADRLDPIGGLGDTLSLGSRIGTEARSRTVDLQRLQELRQRLRESADRLHTAVRAQTPARAADPVSDVKGQLDKLVKDVTDLLAAVQAKDVAKVTTLVNTVVADLQALLTSVPKLLTNAAPLPVPLPL